MPTAREKEKAKRRVVSAKRMAETSAGKQSKAFKLPPGVSPFIINEKGNLEIDIIPYVAGKGNPAADAGELAPGRTYYTHGGVGPNKDTYLCRAVTLNKPCPICDHRALLARDENGDEDLVKALRPKQRQLWNVSDHKRDPKEVRVLDISSFAFGDPLFEKAERNPKYETFADPEEGYTLHIGVTEKKEKYTFYMCSDIEFHERKKPISDEILAKAVCLDDILVDPGYDELKRAYEAIPEDEEDDDKDKDDSDLEPKGKDDSDVEPKAKTGKGKPPPPEPEEPEEEPEGEGEDDSDVEPAAEGGIEIGSLVRFEYKGEEHTGELLKIDSETDLAAVKCEDREKPYYIDKDELALVAGKGEPEADEEEEKPKGKKVSAKACGITLDLLPLFVMHPEFGKCEVIRIAKDDTAIVLEDEEQELHPAIDPSVVKVLKKEKPKAEDNGEHEEPAPKAKAVAKTTSNGKASKEVAFGDEEEEDEKPAPKKKVAGKK